MRNKLIALTLSYTNGLQRRVLMKWVAIWLSVLVVSPWKWIADMLETPQVSTFVYRLSTQSSTTNDSDFITFTWEFVVFESWKENEHKFSWRTIANRNLIRGVYGENLLIAYNIFVLVVWYLTILPSFLKNVLFAITNLEIWIMGIGRAELKAQNTKALSTYLIHSKQRVQLCMWYDLDEWGLGPGAGVNRWFPKTYQPPCSMPSLPWPAFMVQANVLMMISTAGPRA